MAEFSSNLIIVIGSTGVWYNNWPVCGFNQMMFLSEKMIIWYYMKAITVKISLA